MRRNFDVWLTYGLDLIPHMRAHAEGWEPLEAGSYYSERCRSSS